MSDARPRDPTLRPAAPSDDSTPRSLAERHAARAVALLRDATAAGYKDLPHLQKDSVLDALRQRDDFKKLLAELEAQAKK